MKLIGSSQATPGFTLLEVLISFAILSTLLVAIIQSQSESIFFLRKTKSLMIAQKIVINMLLEIERSTTPPETGEGIFPKEHQLAGGKWKLTAEDEDFMGIVSIRRVTYQVFWMENGVQQEYQSSILQ